jgi:hypothetical protein
VETLLGGLLGLLCVLAVVVPVGHLLWVGIAALLRALFGGGGSVAACPGCDRKVPAYHQDCPFCGLRSAGCT